MGEQITPQQADQHRNSSTGSVSEPIMWNQHHGKWYKWSYDSAGKVHP